MVADTAQPSPSLSKLHRHRNRLQTQNFKNPQNPKLPQYPRVPMWFFPKFSTRAKYRFRADSATACCPRECRAKSECTFARLDARRRTALASRRFSKCGARERGRRFGRVATVALDRPRMGREWVSGVYVRGFLVFVFLFRWFV